MKKKLAFVLAFVLLFSLVSGFRSFCEGNLIYYSDGNEITVFGVEGNPTSLDIPAYIDGVPVTSIASRAFFGRTELIWISFPDTLTSMGIYALHGTDWLSSQGNGVIYAGSVAYTYVGRIPSNFEIVLKPGTKGIADYCFTAQTRLSSVVLPDGLEYIGRFAFNRCTALKSIDIPYSVRLIGLSALSNCTGLKKITLPYIVDFPANLFECTYSIFPAGLTIRTEYFSSAYFFAKKNGISLTIIDSSRTNRFCDVTFGQWYYDAVEYVYTHGLFTGITPDLFDPDGHATRAAFITLLSRIENIDTAEYEGMTSFYDVGIETWYSAAVEWAYRSGIISKSDDGNFYPDRFVSREEMCTMADRYLKTLSVNAEGEYLPFNDQDDISDWAVDSVKHLRILEIVNGQGDNYFNPKSDLTRAECAAIIEVLYEYISNIHLTKAGTDL